MLFNWMLLSDGGQYGSVCVVSTMHMVFLLRMISCTQNQQTCLKNLNASVVIRAKISKQTSKTCVPPVANDRIPNLAYLWFTQSWWMPQANSIYTPKHLCLCSQYLSCDWKSRLSINMEGWAGRQTSTGKHLALVGRQKLSRLTPNGCLPPVKNSCMIKFTQSYQMTWSEPTP